MGFFRLTPPPGTRLRETRATVHEAVAAANRSGAGGRYVEVPAYTLPADVPHDTPDWMVYDFRVGWDEHRMVFRLLVDSPDDCPDDAA